MNLCVNNKMAASSTELNVAKKNLEEALGDGMKIYLSILKSWFKQKLTREDFDSEARKLLTADTVHLHNEFLLAVLTKCHSLGSSSSVNKDSSSSTHSANVKLLKKKHKKKTVHSRATFHQRFVPADPLSHVPRIVSKAPEDEGGLCYTSRDMVLPDIGMVHGRMMVAAWDVGLEEIEDNAVRILMSAVQHQLKTILTAVLARRSPYRLRENRFPFAVGRQVPRPHVRNSLRIEDDAMSSEATSITSKGAHIPSVKQSLGTGQRDSALQLSCVDWQVPAKAPISLFDLLDAMMVFKHALPSQTIYSLNMERIINKLWHPSNEEVEQEAKHKKELSLKRELQSQQAMFRT